MYIAGIGPEIVDKALTAPALYQIARPLVIGEAGAVRRALRVTELNLDLRIVNDPDQGRYQPGVIDLVDLEQVAPPLTKPDGYISIEDCGAVANDGEDDGFAIQGCIAKAKIENTAVMDPCGNL